MLKNASWVSVKFRARIDLAPAEKDMQVLTEARYNLEVKL
jgi:hypothetical protein